MFFLPEWLAVRAKQMSVAQITALQDTAWGALMNDGAAWIAIRHVRGAGAVSGAYEEIARGGLGPEVGMVWSMWDEGGLGSKM